MKSLSDIVIDELVKDCIYENSLEELALGWLRYEAIRKLSPRQFTEISKRNLAGESFDDMITAEVIIKDINTKINLVKRKFKDPSYA